MSTFVCPACQRSFAEAGFCPYDGSALLSGKPPDSAAPLVTARDLSVHTSKTAMRSLTMPQFGSTIDTAPPPQSGSVPPALPISVHPPAPTGGLAPGPASTGGASGAVAPIGSELPTHRDPQLAGSVAKPVVRAISAADETNTAVSALGRRGTIYDQLVGQTLDGRYFIERKIGEGGMGVVYSARHTVIERPLAIKVLKKEALRDSATAPRFVQEAKAASRIGHPNIVDVTDFGTTSEGLTYSVMEYVKGTTLAMVLKTAAPLPVPRAVAIAQQLARALGAAHDKGIVHRDLKPENIFLTERDGQSDFVKIVDFGIAKVTPIDGTTAGPRLTRAGSVFGTPEYMAPEQAAGRSDIDGRVDIYAVGVILYEAVTGRLPHKGDSPVRTIAMQLLDPVIPPRQVRPDLDIGEDCEAVILKALAKRRDERYRTMAELGAALEQLLRSRPVRSAPSVGGPAPIVGLGPLPPGADPRLALDSVQIEVTSAATSAPTMALSAEASRGLGQRADALGARARRGSETPPVVAAVPVSSTAPRAHRPSEVPLPVTAPLAVRDEPEFVKTGTAPQVSSFDHVYLEPPPAPPSRRGWWVAGGLLVAVGAGATIAVMMKDPAPRTPVASVGPDARVDEEQPDPPLPADAGPEALAPDGSVERPGEVGGGRDPGRSPGRRKDARTAAPRDVTVQILTYPDDGTVYRGRSYRGPGGTTVQEPYGAVVRFTCTKVGYKDGFVDVKFDEKTPIAVCVMTRKKVCVDDLKNPYDHCPDAGTKPSR